MKEIFIPLMGALATAIGGTFVAWLLARVESGRLARTIEQATRVIDLVERCSAAFDGLAKIDEAKRNEVEKLMLDAMRAVQEDFSTERSVLPEFEKTTSSVRSILMLYRPQGGVAWLPYLLFHSMILFMLYIIVFRLVEGRWMMQDTLALLIAGVIAALVRLAVHLIPGDLSRTEVGGNTSAGM
jgi:hypothetical protein